MDIDLEGIVAIVGNYGSGKTEVAINLAADRKAAGVGVRIADLDLVNPYFRTREARRQLAELGVEVVLPDAKYLQADLPIVSRSIRGLLGQPAPLTLLDAGGDDVGATVLASLGDALSDRSVQMFQVINPFRPFTDTLAGCEKIRLEIEAASRLAVTGFIGNANLIEDTTLEDIYQGHDFVQALSHEAGLPLIFVTVAADLMPAIDAARLTCPVLGLHRQLVPPWKRAAALRR
ncbi:MAG: cobalamin biosynthesis protein CbiA [Desulfobacterales bacterium]|nr:cobalamin biosynthesis protein CbiA [Desulfobacterales bacterium]